MKEITKEWLRYAEADIKTCKSLLDDADLRSVVAFHSQQAIEKCFKAIIEEQDVAIPRIHSLIKLYGTVQDIIIYPIDLTLLQKADSIYSTTRYPSDLGLIPEGKPSKELVLELYQFARSIFDSTVNMLTSC